MPAPFPLQGDYVIPEISMEETGDVGVWLIEDGAGELVIEVNIGGALPVYVPISIYSPVLLAGNLGAAVSYRPRRVLAFSYVEYYYVSTTTESNQRVHRLTMVGGTVETWDESPGVDGDGFPLPGPLHTYLGKAIITLPMPVSPSIIGRLKLRDTASSWVILYPVDPPAPFKLQVGSEWVLVP